MKSVSIAYKKESYSVLAQVLFYCHSDLNEVRMTILLYHGQEFLSLEVPGIWSSKHFRARQAFACE